MPLYRNVYTQIICECIVTANITAHTEISVCEGTHKHVQNNIPCIQWPFMQYVVCIRAKRLPWMCVVYCRD